MEEQVTRYKYSFSHIFGIDEQQLARLDAWRHVQDGIQLTKEMQQTPSPDDFITNRLRERGIPRNSAIAYYFSPGALSTNVKVLYKASGAIVDLTKDDSNEFLYDYNDDFSRKYFMGKDVTEQEVLGVDR